MWFFFFVIASVLTFLLTWKIFAKQENEKLAEHFETVDYNQKVIKMKLAKELLKSNPQMEQHFMRMVVMHTNPDLFTKSDRSKAIAKVLNETADIDVTIAFCALAKIEANKRLKKS